MTTDIAVEEKVCLPVTSQQEVQITSNENNTVQAYKDNANTLSEERECLLSEEELIEIYTVYDSTTMSNDYPSVGIHIKEVHDNVGHSIFMFAVMQDSQGHTHESVKNVSVRYEDLFIGNGNYTAIDRKSRELVNIFMGLLEGNVLRVSDGSVIVKNKTKKVAVESFVSDIFRNAPIVLGERFRIGHLAWERFCPQTYYRPNHNEILRTKAFAEKVVNDLGVIATKDGSLFTYENGVYVRDEGDRKVKAYIDEIAGDDSRNKAKKEVIDFICNKYIVDIEDLTSNTEVVNFKNGYYDLRDKLFKPHDKSFKTIFQLNADYVADGSAACPNITQFLIDILPDERYRNIMLDFLAYCLIPDISLEKAVFMLGAGGNGKSKLLDLFKTLVGKSSYSAYSIHALEENKFAIIGLMDKLMNICGDMPSGKIAECQNFKKVTGGDAITGEEKYKSPITFTAKTRMILSMNHCPVVTESTDIGYFRRIILIRFKRNFEKEVDADGKPIKDAGIMQRLTTPVELSGFMHMLINRLQVMHDKAIESGKGYKIDNLDSDEEVKRLYNINSFSQRQFCDDALEFDSEGVLSFDDCFKGYQMWCQEYSEVEETQRKLISIMEKTLGYKRMNPKTGENGSRTTWEGIRLKSQFNPEAKKIKKQGGIDIKANKEKAEEDRKQKMEKEYWNEYWIKANPILLTHEYTTMMRAFYQKANGDDYPTPEQLQERHLALWNSNHPDEQKTEYLHWMLEYAENPEAYDKKLSEHRARCKEENDALKAKALAAWNKRYPNNQKETPDEEVWSLYRELYR